MPSTTGKLRDSAAVPLAEDDGRTARPSRKNLLRRHVKPIDAN